MKRQKKNIGPAT